jgi:phosphoribosylanthranilate isomerase
LQNLEKTRDATSITPLLCKDFIINEYQIFEARYFGADAILLIAAILTKDQIQHFLGIAAGLRMAAIVEVHTEEELNTALSTSAHIIGINNRDLHTFEVQLGITKKLLPLIPKDKTIISESGISSRYDLYKLPKRVDAILVGTALMKSNKPRKLIRSLIGPPRLILKCCGIRSLRDAIFCQEQGVDLIGLNFVPRSHRRISYQQAAEIIRTLREQKKSKIRIVGIFQDQKLEDVNTVANLLDLDYIQLSGNETPSFVKACVKPVIKGIALRKRSDLKKIDRYRSGIVTFLLDGHKPGSGVSFDHALLKSIKTPYLLAGGISSENVTSVIKKNRPMGIDLASGIETEGQVDQHKIRKILQIMKRA